MNRPQQTTDPRRGEVTDALRAVEFAILDTVLYLDAYPASAEALRHYHLLCEQRKNLLANAKDGYTIYDNKSKTAWDWVVTPFPWEIDG